MILLSLDPGATTGWAVFDTSGVLKDTGNFLLEDLRDGLTGIVEKWDPGEVIVEVFPVAVMGHLAGILQEVVATITEVLAAYDARVEKVTPGVWKTSSVPFSEKTWEGERTTIHQKDAIRMGRFHLRSMDRRTG